MSYIRKISYQQNGNTMSFYQGQVLNDKFRITRIKEGFEGVNHFVDIYISLKDDGSTYTKWKRIINGVTPIEYNVNFLCEENL